MAYLLKCPKCGKIYKCFGKVTVKGLKYITDYGDDVTNVCLCCKKEVTHDVIHTEDWIATLLFKVKGN